METFQTKNLDRGHITVFGEIDDEKIQSVIEQLIYLETKRSLKEITLWINSPGGYLQPSFGLADFMTQLSKPIRTIGVGTVESASTVILTSGTPGLRILTPSSSLMIHEYSWSNSGSVTEMRGRMTEIQNTARKQLEHLVRVSGRSLEEAQKLLQHQETWLSPEAAIEWGLVDAVLDFNPVQQRGVPSSKASRKKSVSKKRSSKKKS